MSKDHEEASKLFKDIGREFAEFASQYSEAVKSGAEEASKHMLDAMLDANRAEDIPSGKLFAAMKSGLRHAGEQLVQRGWGFIHRPRD
ncbi:hypothetical protein [Paenibacillus sp. PL2-23]|uniref:hypothetical protein n=1 Tax=Paenibacillus sp. PL2-23 TaxID=2100729 RepID=UPI0030FCBC15